jgi:hypothetical protein
MVKSRRMRRLGMQEGTYGREQQFIQGFGRKTITDITWKI